MRTKHDIDLDEINEYAGLPRIRNAPVERPGRNKKKIRRTSTAPLAEIAEQVDGQEQFDFSYHASRHERQWIIDSLGGFYEAHWIEDVLQLLKGGKEASVYLCQAHPSLVPVLSGLVPVEPGRMTVLSGSGVRHIAAKVYRPRQFRNLKNDFLYREGRAPLDQDGNIILDGGMQHAMAKRTEYGRQLLHSSWIEHEFQTMSLLYQAGADLPRPHARGNNAILMDYIGVPEMPAPTLNTIDLEVDEAERLFARVLRNIEIMLAARRIHGDLSAYNILYWEGQISLIDFPQAINPHENRNAFSIFQRDVLRVCEYFSRQGVSADPKSLAARLWRAHGYHLKPDVHPRLLDDQDPTDHAYWEALRRNG